MNGIHKFKQFLMRFPVEAGFLIACFCPPIRRIKQHKGVLSGGIFGDHCSPMTDCTILAALGSGCDVMDHAVTQMPYAFTVALVSIFCIISATLGFSAVYTIALGALVLSAIILLFGKQP